jgi:hypothetical protein
VLTEEKLDEEGSRLEYTPPNSLRRLAQQTHISTSVAKAMKLLGFRPYEATVGHALQPRDLASRNYIRNWFMQSVHGVAVDPHLTFFLLKYSFIFTVMFPPDIVFSGVVPRSSSS